MTFTEEAAASPNVVTVDSPTVVSILVEAIFKLFFGRLFVFLVIFFEALFFTSISGIKALAAISFPGTKTPMAANTPHTEDTSMFKPTKYWT